MGWDHTGGRRWDIRGMTTTLAVKPIVSALVRPT
jgi:hypothetical protein